MQFNIVLSMALALSFYIICLLLNLSLEAPQPQQSKECEGSAVKKCPWKFYSHYLDRGCQPQYGNDPCCPNKFKCPDRSIYKDNSVCRYGNRPFELGSPINQSDTCRRCYCRESNTDLIPQIECMHSECPEHLLPTDQDCILLYDSNKECCSTKSFCPATDELNDSKPAPMCHYANKTYIRGERIEFEEDQCVFCICDKGFDGPDGPGCRRVDYCYLDSQENIGKGCLPVFNVDTCCPTEWICPEIDTLPLIYNDENCVFDGKSYPVNTKLPTNLECVECKCKTPPDFTCIQTKCYK